jgi:pyruvate formate lyase activating enzyme
MVAEMAAQPGAHTAIQVDDVTSRPAPHWTPAVLGVPGTDGRVTCQLCPHACSLRPGQAGLCRVRRNEDGRLLTATFAVSVAHLTSIERKPLYHVRPGTRVLTLAAPGCTFRCDYCINHALSQFGREAAVPWQGSPARPADLVQRAAAADASIGLSYTEPGLAPELTLALASLAAPQQIRLIWKTNGFLTPAAVRLVAPVLDAVNIDVKAATNAAHQKLTGASLAPVLEAIELFRAAGVWVEVSTPLVPGVAAEPGQWRVIAGTIADIDPGIPWHLLRFTPDFRMTRCAPTAPRALAEAVAVGHRAGLQFVYVERALGEPGRRTDCPACGTVLIKRGIWDTQDIAMAPGGRCPGCGYQVPGRWSDVG